MIVIKIAFVFILTSIIILQFSSQNVKAGHEIRVDKEETYVYKVTHNNIQAMNTIDPKYKIDAEEGEKCCYKIYEIDKKHYHYRIRYKMWDWTEDENKFYQDYDSRSSLKVPKYGYVYGNDVESLHNNSDILMNIVMCKVEDFLDSIDWNISKVFQIDRTVIKIESSYEIYHEYSKEGFLKKYYIISDSEIIFRAIYIGNLENPTENNLLFNLISLIIISSTIIAITITSALVVKKIGGRNKYTIDQIVEKEDKIK